MNLKWGVIGAGSVAQRRAMPAINKAINAELHALMSRDEVRAKQLAETHGASKYYTSVEDLISIGFKKNKTYKVDELPKALSAYFGFIKFNEPARDGKTKKVIEYETEKNTA